MSEKLQVYIRQLRYNEPVGMDTGDVANFITLMRKFASDIGTELPTISAPKDSSSIRFEFEVVDD